MAELIPTSMLWAPEHHSIWEQHKALLYRDQRDLQRGASAACHAALMKKLMIQREMEWGTSIDKS